MGMVGQGHAPSALPPPPLRKRTGARCIRGWVSPRAGLDWRGKFCHHRDSKTGLEGIKSYRQQRLYWQVNTSLPYMSMVRVIPQSLWLEAWLQLACHRRGECAKSCARRSVCFCSQSGGGASVLARPFVLE
jgi:hypothetical protein